MAVKGFSKPDALFYKGLAWGCAGRGAARETRQGPQGGQGCASWCPCCLCVRISADAERRHCQAGPSCPQRRARGAKPSACSLCCGFKHSCGAAEGRLGAVSVCSLSDESGVEVRVILLRYVMFVWGVLAGESMQDTKYTSIADIMRFGKALLDN